MRSPVGREENKTSWVLEKMISRLPSSRRSDANWSEVTALKGPFAQSTFQSLAVLTPPYWEMVGKNLLD